MTLSIHLVSRLLRCRRITGLGWITWSLVTMRNGDPCIVMVGFFFFCVSHTFDAEPVISGSGISCPVPLSSTACSRRDQSCASKCPKYRCRRSRPALVMSRSVTRKYNSNLFRLMDGGRQSGVVRGFVQTIQQSSAASAIVSIASSKTRLEKICWITYGLA